MCFKNPVLNDPKLWVYGLTKVYGTPKSKAFLEQHPLNGKPGTPSGVPVSGSTGAVTRTVAPTAASRRSLFTSSVRIG